MPIIRRHAVAISLVLMPASAQGAFLAPHQAVYDLSLSAKTEELLSVDGRIAFQLKIPECGAYGLDYRFVARFEEAEEITLTDQQTLSREDQGGSSFEFETKTFVDGTPQEVVRGRASNDAEATTVDLEEPLARAFSLPLSHFPLSHTSDLIRKAAAGETIVESKLFDGDDDAEKLLTTTAIIGPAAPPAPSAIAEKLAGIRAWRIDESYFNADSDPDGMPIFHTRYTLYENGVSDAIYMDFGDYALEGSLARLDYYDAPACP